MTDPATACATKLFNRFRRFKGEWFRNTSEGVPYLQIVFVKNPDMRQVESLFREVILTTPPVSYVDSLSLALDKATRKLSFAFRAVLDNGQVIVGGSGEPFVVRGSP